MSHAITENRTELQQISTNVATKILIWNRVKLINTETWMIMKDNILRFKHSNPPPPPPPFHMQNGRFFNFTNQSGYSLPNSLTCCFVRWRFYNCSLSLTITGKLKGWRLANYKLIWAHIYHMHNNPHNSIQSPLCGLLTINIMEGARIQ